MKTIIPHPEIIKWSDAHHVKADLDFEEIEAEGLPQAITMGLVMYENNDLVAICQTQFLDSEKPFRHVLFIPKVMIIKRKKLK